MRSRVLTRRAFAAAAISGLAAVMVYGWMRPGPVEATPPTPPPTWQNVTLTHTIAKMDGVHNNFVQQLNTMGPVAFRAHVVATFNAASDAEKGFVTNWVQEQGALLCPDLLIDFVEQTIGQVKCAVSCEGAVITLAEVSATNAAAFPVGSKARVANLIPLAPSDAIATLLAAAHTNLLN